MRIHWEIPGSAAGKAAVPSQAGSLATAAGSFHVCAACLAVWLALLSWSELVREEGLGWGMKLN